MFGFGAFGEFSFGESSEAEPGVISFTGIPSAETFGTMEVFTDSYVIAPVAIDSAEDFGTLIVSGDLNTIYLGDLASAEAFGTMTLQIVYNGVSRATGLSGGNRGGSWVGQNIILWDDDVPMAWDDDVLISYDGGA